MKSCINCPECEAALIVPDMPFGPGYVVGRFEIREQLGIGGMGEVYLAKQLSMNRLIALKILPVQYTKHSNFVVRFLKEVHHQARLDHPNIVTAYEAGEDNGVYFMAMAFVDGENLEDVLDREGVLSEAKALNILRQVSEALQYAWEEHGVMHRDIKPANLMLVDTGKVKILDLGLSESIHDSRSHTQNDTIMGTPNYMSPEQIEAPNNIDTRSDMYALGMSLYHMLTGQVPFEESHYLKTIRRQATEKLSDPRECMTGISAGATRLIERLIARTPKDRFPDWQSVLAAISQAEARQPLLITPPEGESTLNRREDTAEEVVAPPPPKKRSKQSKAGPSFWGVVTSVLIGLGIGVSALIALIVSNPSLFGPTDPAEPGNSTTSDPQQMLALLEQRMADAISYARLESTRL